MLSGIRSVRPLPEGKRRRETCGEGGIRTLDTDFGPYNGLANRRLRPLGHLSRLRAVSSTVLPRQDPQAAFYRREARLCRAGSPCARRWGGPVGGGSSPLPPSERSERRGGGVGIRTLGAFALRFSRPSPSTTRPLLREWVNLRQRPPAPNPDDPHQRRQPENAHAHRNHPDPADHGGGEGAWRVGGRGPR